MNILIYDTEIKKAIPSGQRDPDVKYCNGWTDYAGMGISVITAADYSTGRFHVFLNDNKEGFAKAVSNADVIVGFNQINFDNNVVLANWGIQIPKEKNFDILAEIWKALGGRKKGYGLDAICKANFGIEKTGDGALAPVLWQQKKAGEVIDYCMNDTKMTQLVFEKIRKDGFLLDPVKEGQKILIQFDHSK